MTAPSSQILAVWVQEEIPTTTWTSLREVLFSTLRVHWEGPSDEEVWECVDDRIAYVADDLRNCVSEWQIDGTPSRFDIDNEPIPYIRLAAAAPSEVASKLRRISPFAFEDICAKFLKLLGASSYTTQKSYDGGVDFVGVNLSGVRSDLMLPLVCRSAVIGQAKRYKDGNLVGETKLREFVGAATLKRHVLSVEGNIQPCTPVLYAFWTTSNFDPNARKFARAVGLWYMDGATLASYASLLGLASEILALPDDEKPAG